MRHVWEERRKKRRQKGKNEREIYHLDISMRKEDNIKIILKNEIGVHGLESSCSRHDNWRHFVHAEMNGRVL